MPSRSVIDLTDDAEYSCWRYDPRLNGPGRGPSSHASGALRQNRIFPRSSLDDGAFVALHREVVSIPDDDSDLDSSAFDLIPSASGQHDQIDELHRQLPSQSRRTLTKYPRTRDTRNSDLHIGSTVELMSGDFPRICSIIEQEEIWDTHRRDHFTSQVYIRGLIMQHVSKSSGVLPQARDADEGSQEYFIELDLDEDDQRQPFDQGQRSVKVEEVVRKHDVAITNTPGSVWESDQGTDPAMACRWARVNHFASARHRTTYRARRRDKLPPKYIDFRRIREAEADAAHRSKDAGITEGFLGYKPHDKGFYTGADVCCCAGGASVGMTAAGINVHWALDADDKALETYRLNFPDVEIINERIEDAIQRMTNVPEYFHVDVMHISWPCPAFAHCNTRPNAELDAKNTAPILATSPLIALAKPRIVLLENTSGLAVITKHKAWFHKLLSQLTENDYSVRFTVTHFDKYGAAHKRKRLMIFAACPGGELPNIPQETHTALGPAEGKKHFTTINDALRPLTAVPEGTYTHHAPTSLERNFLPSSQLLAHAAAHDGNRPLKQIISTSGSLEYHPSGLRRFSVREYALLQGSPVTFDFHPDVSDTKLVEGVGNAVPPCGIAPFFMEARRALERADRADRAHRIGRTAALQHAVGAMRL